MTTEDLFAKWEAEAVAMQRRGVLVNGSSLLTEVLADLRATLSMQADALLSLPEAASLSGYSVEHLGRLVREGRIPNNGRKGAPRVRRADLPRKPVSLVSAGPRPYDPDADSRNLLDRQRGGSNG